MVTSDFAGLCLKCVGTMMSFLSIVPLFSWGLNPACSMCNIVVAKMLNPVSTADELEYLMFIPFLKIWPAFLYTRCGVVALHCLNF